MSKEEKKEAAPPAKNKAKLFIIIGVVLVLLLGIGGAAAFMMMSSGKHDKANAAEVDAEEEIAADEHPPAFIEVGTFTTNLAKEDGNRVIQISISLKLTKPELEPKVKVHNPEISDFVVRLLHNTLPSEMLTIEGKELAAERIRAYVEYLFKLRKKEPKVTSTLKELKAAGKKKSNVDEVLFTSMIIQ